MLNTETKIFRFTRLGLRTLASVRSSLIDANVGHLSPGDSPNDDFKQAKSYRKKRTKSTLVAQLGTCVLLIPAIYWLVYLVPCFVPQGPLAEYGRPAVLF